MLEILLTGVLVVIAAGLVVYGLYVATSRRGRNRHKPSSDGSLEQTASFAEADHHPMPMDELVGSRVVAIHYKTLLWAVDELVKADQNDLRTLKIRSGEHLAAILLTALFGSRPTEFDHHGEIDLIFDVSEPKHASKALAGSCLTAAFEIKSLSGPFRKVESDINRKQKAGADATGMGVTVRVSSANEIMTEAKPMIDAAAAGLNSKVAAGTSRNAFLVVHPFDHFAAEMMKPFIAHSLAPLDDCDLDSVWVLWAPSHLTVWSRAESQWTNVIFAAVDPGEQTPADDSDLDMLQYAEVEFLAKSNRGDSPYVFGLTA